MSNRDMPATPFSFNPDLLGTDQSSGLTKLEYFAAHAPAMPAWYDSNTPDPERFFNWPWHYAHCVLEGGPL